MGGVNSMGHLIDDRKRWHETITDELVRVACKRRKLSLDIGKIIAAHIEDGEMVPPLLSQDAVHILRDGHPLPGICLMCGAQWEGIAQDARFEKCLDCGAAEVFGCDELIKELSHERD